MKYLFLTLFLIGCSPSEQDIANYIVKKDYLTKVCNKIGKELKATKVELGNRNYYYESSLNCTMYSKYGGYLNFDEGQLRSIDYFLEQK